MKFLIINADDFGKYTSVNEGIIEGINKGVITSTSILIYGNQIADATKIKDNNNISVGLHFEPVTKDENKLEEEFYKQIKLFTNLVGRKPDHIDSHKVRLWELPNLKKTAEEYSKKTKTPLRDLGFANFIDSFFGLSSVDYRTTDLNRVTSEALIKVFDTNLQEGYNEIMTHAGYADDAVIKTSTYNIGREHELKALLSKGFSDYLAKHQEIKLVSWNKVAETL